MTFFEEAINEAIKLLKACGAIAVALFAIMSLSGCGASSSGSAVPGAYGVDPRSVSTVNVEASDMAIVVAPCQGQAFQISPAAFSYAKKAIENQGYVSVTQADGVDVTGKRYALTKSSESGREDELKCNETEFFSFACSARAQNEGVRLLEAMNAAAGDLVANAMGNDKVLVVVASGITNGLLQTSSELLASDTGDVVAQLESMGAIADYSGVTVVYYGLGQSTGNQMIPSSAAAQIKSLMVTIVEAGGGNAVVSADQLTPLGCDAELPSVEVVDLGVDSINIPKLSEGQSAAVSLTESELSFKADSSEFADLEQASGLLSELAKEITKEKYVIDVVGHTADIGGPGDGKELSYERALTVKEALVDFGLPINQIGEVSGVGCSESTSYQNGVFDEEQAKKDRKVVLKIHA